MSQTWAARWTDAHRCTLDIHSTQRADVGGVCPAHASAGTEARGARYAELRLPLTFSLLEKKVQRAGR